MAEPTINSLPNGRELVMTPDEAQTGPVPGALVVALERMASAVSDGTVVRADGWSAYVRPVGWSTGTDGTILPPPAAPTPATPAPPATPDAGQVASFSADLATSFAALVADDVLALNSAPTTEWTAWANGLTLVQRQVLLGSSLVQTQLASLSGVSPATVSACAEAGAAAIASAYAHWGDA